MQLQCDMMGLKIISLLTLLILLKNTYFIENLGLLVYKLCLYQLLPSQEAERNYPQIEISFGPRSVSLLV